MTMLSRFAASGILVIALLHDLTLAARFAGFVVHFVDGGVIGDADLLTEELVHRAVGVRSLFTGQGDSRSFTLLSPSEK
jgi:ABC-type hemin transport system ATPase subunit